MCTKRNEILCASIFQKWENVRYSLQYFTKADDEFTGTLQISKSLLYFGCAFLLLLLSCKCSGDLNDAVSEKKYFTKI